MDTVLVDAGPLVALVDSTDAKHARCTQVLPTLPRLATVWPAVVEAAYMVRKWWSAQAKLLDWIADGAVALLPLGPEDIPRIKALMAKYRDLPMDFADAALVRVAEREGVRRIFTVDGDFAIYRPAKIGRFEIVR